MASKNVCTSAVVVSPNPLSPTPSTSTAMKYQWNMEEDLDDHEPAVGGDIHMEYSCDYLYSPSVQTQTKWAMYVWRNIEVRSSKHCCSGEIINITYCESICSLRYPACCALAPCYRLWPVHLYKIFPHYLINGTIIGKKLLNIKCVFWFSLQLLSETFLIPRRTEWDVTKNIYWPSCKVPVIRVRF